MRPSAGGVEAEAHSRGVGAVVADTNKGLLGVGGCGVVGAGADDGYGRAAGRALDDDTVEARCQGWVGFDDCFFGGEAERGGKGGEVSSLNCSWIVR